MDIGAMNKRIIIQKQTSTQDENGFPVPNWNDYKPVWSSKSNLYGREFYAAATVNAEQTEKFTIRYLKDLDADINIEGNNTTKIFRIKYKNSILNIKFIDDIKSEHRFMEIKALSEV